MFFDIGSTLVDEHIAYERRIQEMSESNNIDYNVIYNLALSFYKQNKKGEHEAAKQLNIDVPKWHKEDEILYDNTVKCLEALHKKYKIGIIANQSLGTKSRLERYGILKYIDLIVASAEEGVSKPNKKIFEIALERSCCSPHKSIMIGDRIDNDIIPAKKMGMNTIWIKQGLHQHWNITEDFEKADLTVNNLNEIVDFLLNE
ncbi:MAG: HAD family hydrolase [Clostridia bacterium]|nr:HAD family hydrolase [Clostridia bacterium]